MIAKVVSNRWIELDQITTHEEDVLEKHFSATPKSMRYIDLSKQHWDGTFRKYDRANKRLNRSFLSELRYICEKSGLPLTIFDTREPPKFYPNLDNVKPDMLSGITLDDTQINAIKTACEVEVGIFDLPTGAGKGEILAGICKAIECPTVVIAEQRIVIEQLKRRLEIRDVVEEAGLFCAGRTPSDQLIIVGTIQSLNTPSKAPEPPKRLEDDSDSKWAKKLEKHEVYKKAFKTRLTKAKHLRKLIGNCDMLLVDEADRATNKLYRRLFLNWFTGRRKYGFSGTVFDPDKPVENLVLKEHLGSVIYKESREKLTATGRIIPVNYSMLAFGDPSSKNDRTAFDIAVNELLCENNQYHELIAALCKSFDQNDGTLILVERDLLGYNLANLIPNSQFIHGKTAPKARNMALRSFEKREFNVLIGGKILKRGLDLSGGCENLILASGGKLWSDFIQQIGRAVRHNKKGKANIYDFMFLNNHYLYDHSRKRLKFMASIYPTKVIFPDGVVDGNKFIASRFRKPKF